MTQPSLFDPEATPAPIRARCWRCRKTTPHRLLSAYTDGARMLSCDVCRAGCIVK